MQRFRKYIFTLLSLSLVGSFVIAIALQPLVSATFATREFSQCINPLVVAVISVIGLIVLATLLWLALWRSPSSSSAKPPLAMLEAAGLPALPSQVIVFVLVFGALNCLTFCFLIGDIEALVVRLSAKRDVFYEETVKETYQKGCGNAVEWIDSFVGGSVTVCLTSPLFTKHGGPISRLSIVHSLRGPFGIRVLTVHAVDSEPGRVDFSQMQTNPATH
ncbi:hypothetical protein [Burkholderia plantarii]|uniref:hypothetical protein n=1 Tax=Burkholderia plantarii TaxID=41899 RepID=UPI000705D410|nr:hypothetical protein [Burkholderia plantarii]ALK33671.1 hypothetical protein bpln_2g14450 [Burkholderia plantarii]GLZ16839.1 hypothetical protein Bpla01_03690 [Burkholderia plantarii]